MLIVPRDLKPPLILSIALIASCLSMPESPGPEHQTEAETDQGLREAAELDAQDIREAEALDALLLEQSYDTDITHGGHCNVRLMECDPYPIGKGKHRRADAMCSSVCLDTIAHCEDYKPAELEWCCAHPDTNYHDASGREYTDKHCMPSGEPNWSTHCAAGLNP
jgi:hypothetical protein